MNGSDADEAYRERVKANYKFSEWAGKTREGDREARMADFLIRSDELQGWRLEEKEELSPSDRQRHIVRYVFKPAREGGGGRLVSTVFECSSVLDAHETLIDVVMTYMAPDLPRCEAKGLEVGDICFGSHGPVNLSVIFARFNILVEVKSTDPEAAPVDEFARGVDSLIYDQYLRAKET